jgi:hypothetical protein
LEDEGFGWGEHNYALVGHLPEALSSYIGGYHGFSKTGG